MIEPKDKENSICSSFREFGEAHGAYYKNLIINDGIYSGPECPKPRCIERIVSDPTSSYRLFQVLVTGPNDNPLKFTSLPDIGDKHPLYQKLRVTNLMIVRRLSRLQWEIKVEYGLGFVGQSAAPACWYCGWLGCEGDCKSRLWITRGWEVSEPIIFAACLGWAALSFLGGCL